MNKCIHIFRGVIAVLMVALFAPSCADDMYDNSPNEPLKLSADSLTVNLSEQRVSVGVTARDASWTMTGAEEWLTVSPASGEKGITQVALSFAAYDDEGAPSRLATLTFSSGGAEKSIIVTQLSTDYVLPNENPDSPVNRMIHEQLAEWYYNGEPQTAPPDFNQSYLDFYNNYLEKLDRNELDSKEWSMGSEPYLYSYIERNPIGTALAATPPLNYGMEFDLAEFDGRLMARILFVESGSPAAAAGLKRGDWFYKVNNTQMGTWEADRPVFGGKYHYNRIIDTLVNPIQGESPTLSMISFQPAGEQFTDQGRTVTISPSNFSGSPIFHTQVIREPRLAALGGEMTHTGYMMYNSFDDTPRHREELIQRFTEFKNRPEGEELENFILDLRYNKSGSVEMAELMGDLLVGDVPGVAGKTFARYEFYKESTAAAHSKTVSFSRHEAGIGVDTVFILTSPHTAGASELLINALRGLDQSVVKLVVVGATTQGLAAGMVKRTVDYQEWEYSAWMLAFRCYNAANDGNYIYGLVPNGGEVSEWQRRSDNIKWSTTWGWKGETGSTEDAIVRRAVDMIVGRQFIPEGDVVDASKQNRTGYPRKFCFPTNMTMSINDE